MRPRKKWIAMYCTCGVPRLVLITLLIGLAPYDLSADDLDDVALTYNLRYRDGESKSWVLDLAVPKAPSEKPRPAIVVIHGGGWIEGDKSSFSTPNIRPPGNTIDFARLGFVAATINYRLAREAPYPAAIHDCKNAVRFLRANAQKYQIDPERIGVWGNSAGGHLALLLGMTNGDASLEGDGPYRDQSSRVHAMVSDSGPIDLVHQHKTGALRSVVELLMGGPPDQDRSTAYQQASPSGHVAKQLPPLLLIYGEADEQVPVETADRFVVELSRAGVTDVSYQRLGKAGHCPHSLLRVPYLVPAVNDFFFRTLRLDTRAK
ncbi:MAG: alpha/beta hydrolase [Planctomycetia bacterium]|nr:alpha/beta hydrolase [Planctomycetia bacterium]